jgi:hypothetical protein
MGRCTHILRQAAAAAWPQAAAAAWPALTARRNAFYLGRSGIADIQGKAPPPPRPHLRPRAPLAQIVTGIRVAFLSGAFAATAQARLPQALVEASCTAALLFAAQELRGSPGAHCAAQQRRQVTPHPHPPPPPASALFSCRSFDQPLIFLNVSAFECAG